MLPVTEPNSSRRGRSRPGWFRRIPPIAYAPVVVLAPVALARNWGALLILTVAIVVAGGAALVIRKCAKRSPSNVWTDDGGTVSARILPTSQAQLWGTQVRSPIDYLYNDGYPCRLSVDDAGISVAPGGLLLPHLRLIPTHIPWADVAAVRTSDHGYQGWSGRISLLRRTGIDIEMVGPSGRLTSRDHIDESDPDEVSAIHELGWSIRGAMLQLDTTDEGDVVHFATKHATGRPT